MAQFDVFLVRGTYLLDCQADFLNDLETRFVVPLLPVGEVPRVHRLNPVFQVSGAKLVMATQLGSPVPTRQLKEAVGSLANDYPTIVNAFDMLLTGY
jgi:toxin CcdB